MHVNIKCHACGKSLLSLKQITSKGLRLDNWDCSRWHFKCWRELQYQLDLQHITEGMSKLSLHDHTHSTTSFSWQLLLLLLLYLSLSLFFSCCFYRSSRSLACRSLGVRFFLLLHDGFHVG